MKYQFEQEECLLIVTGDGVRIIVFDKGFNFRMMIITMRSGICRGGGGVGGTLRYY